MALCLGFAGDEERKKQEEKVKACMVDPTKRRVPPTENEKNQSSKSTGQCKKHKGPRKSSAK